MTLHAQTRPPALDPRTLRDAFGAFPSGVVAVAASVKGQLTGIAASSFTSVSIDPPLVSFSISTTSSTWPLLREADRLGISVLADHHDAVCRQLAGPREERFAGLPFRVTENGAVLLDEAVATYDCSVHEEVVAGDHVIVLLEVHEVGGGDGEHPLVFHRSAFAKLHRDDLDPARLDGRINGAEVDRGAEQRHDADAAARTPHECPQGHVDTAAEPAPRRARLGGRRHHRVVRLLPLRHRRRPWSSTSSTSTASTARPPSSRPSRTFAVGLLRPARSAGWSSATSATGSAASRCCC